MREKRKRKEAKVKERAREKLTGERLENGIVKWKRGSV